MSLINVNNLTFAYEGSYDNIFENISFQIDTDWKLGFTGRNGRGKTTFLNLLLEKFSYDGSISASVDFEYFPFAVSDSSRLTIDVVDTVLADYEYWELSRELNLLQVSDEVLYRPFSTLSKGEQTKVLLAALFLRENSFLLIDEPTNHLDMEARKLVAEYLRRKKGFILVSHDRAFLDYCIDHILAINKTNIEVQKGNFFSWFYNKELQDSHEMAENQRLLRDIKSLEVAARRTAKWSDKVEKTKNGQKVSGIKPDKGHIGAMAAKTMKRSLAIQGRRQAAIDEKSRLLKNSEGADTLKIHPLKHHVHQLIELSGLSMYYGAASACSDVTFTINQGDRIALRGRNGSGKSSIIKVIIGEGMLLGTSGNDITDRLPEGTFTSCSESLHYTGTLRKASGLKISYVNQDTSHLSGKLTDYARDYDIDETLFMTILRKLDFSRIQLERDMEDYSGGQKKKVLIARSLCESAHLYIWDEPLNFIDVISRMQIESLLAEYAPTILFVEHDQAFCETIASKIVEL